MLSPPKADWEAMFDHMCRLAHRRQRAAAARQLEVVSALRPATPHLSTAVLLRIAGFDGSPTTSTPPML